MSKESNSSGGIGVVGLIGVAFVVLKLCGVIDWPWWYVTIPFYGGLVIVAFGAVVYGLLLSFSAGKKRRPYHGEAKPEPKSKFIQKLEEAQRVSDEARKAKLN